MHKYLFIDGTYYLYKFHHAFNLLDKHNNRIGGFFGFMKMLIESISLYDGILVAFDTSSSFRKSIYPSYKSRRPAKPACIIDQEQKLYAAVDCLGICRAYTCTGFEADDVIATMCKTYKNKGTCTIYSRDKDLFYLTSYKNIFISDYNKSLTFPVKDPSYMQGFLALAGDACDNIPGVPSFGPKTASKILNLVPQLKHNPLTYNFHSFIDSLDTKGFLQKTINKLKYHVNEYFLSWSLIQLNENLPLNIDISLKTIDYKKLDLILKDFPFLNFLLKKKKLKQVNTIKDPVINFKYSDKYFSTDGKTYCKLDFKHQQNNAYFYDNLTDIALVKLGIAGNFNKILRHFNFFGYYFLSEFAYIVFLIFKYLTSLPNILVAHQFRYIRKNTFLNINVRQDVLPCVLQAYTNTRQQLLNSLCNSLNCGLLESIQAIASYVDKVHIDKYKKLVFIDNLVNSIKAASLINSQHILRSIFFDTCGQPSFYGLNYKNKGILTVSKDYRKLFIPNFKQSFVIADIKQFDIRLAVYLSRDKNLIKLIDKHEDFYLFLCKKFFLNLNRQQVKQLVLSNIFSYVKLDDFNKDFIKQFKSVCNCITLLHDVYKDNGFFLSHFLKRCIKFDKNISFFKLYTNAAFADINNQVIFHLSHLGKFIAKHNNKIIFTVQKNKSEVFCQAIHQFIRNTFSINLSLTTNISQKLD